VSHSLLNGCHLAVVAGFWSKLVRQASKKQAQTTMMLPVVVRSLPRHRSNGRQGIRSVADAAGTCRSRSHLAGPAHRSYKPNKSEVSRHRTATRKEQLPFPATYTATQQRRSPLQTLASASFSTPNCSKLTSSFPPPLSLLLSAPAGQLRPFHSRHSLLPLGIAPCSSSTTRSKPFSTSRLAMAALKLDGTAIAKGIREKLHAEIAEKQKANPRYQPSLKIIQGIWRSITGCFAQN
jgi:hypothetical protein